MVALADARPDEVTDRQLVAVCAVVGPALDDVALHRVLSELFAPPGPRPRALRFAEQLARALPTDRPTTAVSALQEAGWLALLRAPGAARRGPLAPAGPITAPGAGRPPARATTAAAGRPRSG